MNGHRAEAAQREHEVSSVATPPAQDDRLLIFGGPDHSVYLGCLSCSEYAADSVFNQFGTHGNEYAADSVLNAYGKFGSKYSMYSACDEYASDPPVVVDGAGAYYGRLTVNEHRDPIKSTRIVAWLTGVCAE